MQNNPQSYGGDSRVRMTRIVGAPFVRSLGRQRSLDFNRLAVPCGTCERWGMKKPTEFTAKKSLGMGMKWRSFSIKSRKMFCWHMYIVFVVNLGVGSINAVLLRFPNVFPHKKFVYVYTEAKRKRFPPGSAFGKALSQVVVFIFWVLWWCSLFVPPAVLCASPQRSVFASHIECLIDIHFGPYFCLSYVLNVCISQREKEKRERREELRSAWRKCRQWVLPWSALVWLFQDSWIHPRDNAAVHPTVAH